MTPQTEEAPSRDSRGASGNATDPNHSAPAPALSSRERRRSIRQALPTRKGIDPMTPWQPDMGKGTA